MRIVAAERLLPSAGEAWIEGGAVLVAGSKIVAMGAKAELAERWPHVPCESFGAAAILPGFVNAHQHGRGTGQVLMGYEDDSLEPWIAQRRRHGPPDIYAVTRLAAERMLANGVTATLHANYSYASGDYKAELDAQVRAYGDSGIRATICVGYQDRGFDTYPERADAPEAIGVPRPYAGDIHATIALMERLLEQHGDSQTISFAYGPAGPQWVCDEAWRALAADASHKGLGLHFHLLESPAQAAASRRLYGASTLCHLRELGVFEARTSCAHATHIEFADLRIARQNRLTIVANPGSNLRLYNGAPPLTSFFAEGEPAMGTDNASLAEDEDYLAELRLGAVLARAPGIEARGPNAKAVLHAATIAGSRAAFLPEGSGRIAPGLPADLVVIDLEPALGGLGRPPIDLLALILARGRGADIRLTVVNGRILYRASRDDRERLESWQRAAVKSLAGRSEKADAQEIRSSRARLRLHYARPSYTRSDLVS